MAGEAEAAIVGFIASAIRTSFGAGGNRTVHAQVMTLRLIAVTPPHLPTAQPLSLPSDARAQSGRLDDYALLPYVVGANGKEPATADYRRRRQAVITAPQSIGHGPWPNT